MAAEFDLLVECCRWSFAGGDDDAIQRLARSVDWLLLERLAERHRVEALAWTALTDAGCAISDGVGERLHGRAAAIVGQNLRMAAECGRLNDAFTADGIALLFVKGLTLAALAYPNPSLKMGWDIDIAVAPEDIGRAAALMRALGYVPRLPKGAPDRRIIDWHRSRKESVWYAKERGIHVDLHSRLADNPLLLPGLGVNSPRQTVDVGGGVRLPTLADPELFAFLCVHGASSAWFRLKWISDLAAFRHARRNSIADLYDRSQRLGAGRAADQAILLAHRLFGIGESALIDAVARDRVSRWLADTAYGALNGRRAIREPTERRLGTAAIHLTQFALRPSLRFKGVELVRQVRSLSR